MQTFPEVEAEFNSILGQHLSEDQTPHLPSPNFMTPDLLGYVDAPDGARVEISTGFFIDHRLIVVTPA
jgi:hypothetical protein